MCAENFRTGLERVPQRELKSARSSGAEELSGGLEWAVEVCRIDGIVEPRVVPVCCAPDIGDIEQVEGFGDDLQGMRFFETKHPAHSHVKGVEVVAEFKPRIHLKRSGSSGVQQLRVIA